MKVVTGKMNKRDFVRRCSLLSAGIVCSPLERVLPVQGEMSKYRKEAMFQEETPRGIMCRICPNACILKEGEISKCNNRIVHNSRLYTMAYGNPCAVNNDPVEKKPLYHFYPGSRAFSIATAGCNLVCLNCQNWSISQVSPEKTRNIELSPVQVVNEAIKNKAISIAYTYSEPNTFFEYAFDTATIARASGIRNIFKSNGYINAEPLKKICTVIDAANIDLKSFNESTYLRLSGGNLRTVLDSLKTYLDNGIWLEITNLVIPSWTDRMDEITRMCDWLAENGFRDTPIHFSRFYPLHKLDQLPPTPVDILFEAASIATSAGMNYVYVGNVPGNEKAVTVCQSCKKTVIDRKGYSILSNNIINGKCKWCGSSIPGRWI